MRPVRCREPSAGTTMERTPRHDLPHGLKTAAITLKVVALLRMKRIRAVWIHLVGTVSRRGWGTTLVLPPAARHLAFALDRLAMSQVPPQPLFTARHCHLPPPLARCDSARNGLSRNRLRGPSASAEGGAAAGKRGALPPRRRSGSEFANRRAADGPNPILASSGNELGRRLWKGNLH